MTTKGYVLIEATVGRARDVAQALKSVAGIVEAYLITGPYDLVAVIEGDTAADISDVVTSVVHLVPGVARTTTCLSIPEHEPRAG